MDIFQSTLPVWGATFERMQELDAQIISIHAPRVGSDYFAYMETLNGFHFNPRSPCGERLYVDDYQFVRL